MNNSDPDRAQGELADAVRSGAPDAVARAAMDNIWPLFQHHHAALISAVVALPEAVLDRYPVLRLLHPVTPVLARTTHPFKPLLYPDAARALSREELDITLLAQIIAFRLSGDLAASVTYADRLDERIGRSPVGASGETDGPRWYLHFQIGSTRLAAGQFSRALADFATARQLGQLSSQCAAVRMALGRMALAHAMRGSIDDAQRAITELRRFDAPGAAHIDATLTSEAAAEALIAVERQDPDVDAVLERLEPFDSVEVSWPFALLARARGLIARQQPEHALEVVRLADETHPRLHGSFASDVIVSSRIAALAMLGDTVQARELVDGVRHPGTLTRIAAVRLALHEGRLDAAEAGLSRLERDRNLGPGQRSECLVLSVWAQFERSGRLESDVLCRLRRLAENRNARRMLGSLPIQVIDAATVGLAPDLRARFTDDTSGLLFADVDSRLVLTKGELRVLTAITLYPTTAAIAAAHHISPNTVKSHLKSLYKKLGCSTREEAAKAGSKLVLLTRDGD